MKTRTLFLASILFSLQIVFVNAQKLILQHRKKVQRTKRVDLTREYAFKINDSTYYFGRIVSFTDSTLRLPITKKVDSAFTTKRIFREYVKNPDTGRYETEDTIKSVTSVAQIYKSDTINISFADIQMIRKDWFKNVRWVEPFGWIIAGCVFGVVVLPVAYIEDGNRGIRDWATAEGVTLGVCIPIILLGNGATTYNLSKKWSLAAR
jgi:hypothetical protein